jgi:alginate O-acetyltransferase complex protein AlgI
VLFTEPTFLFLFLPVLLALYFLPSHRHRNWLLLVASVVFYAKGGGSFTWLIALSIAFNYYAAIWVDRYRGTRTGTWLLRSTVAVNLLVLAIFKYANFIADNVNAVLTATGAPPVSVPPVLLPIGISFFTFHAISYVVDVYRRDASAQKHPVEAALYLLLFPQLIAGPIIRYREIAGQLARRIVTSDDLAYGIRRFIVGFAKKMLVANTVAGPADQIFAMPAAQLTPAHAWLAIVCYTLQIYFDFSGYSDMAIGLGRMFGFRFPENFRYPYIATSVQDFWRRWHISLSAWFRDYVYVPLGGNRVPSARLYLNLVTVFFLCGLWHGASWNFVIWGLFHGTFLVIERLGVADRVERMWKPLRHAYLLLVVMVGWVFFRADTLPGALAFLRSMAGFGATQPTSYEVTWYLTPEVGLALVAGAIAATPIVPAIATTLSRPLIGRSKGGADVQQAGQIARLAWLPSAAATAGLLLLLAASVMLSAARTYNPFIYFRF